MATTSMPSWNSFFCSSSQSLNTFFERPGTMSSSLEGPVPSRIGVKSMITVTYLLPRRVWDHTCSSTPSTFTVSNRVGSLISNWRPVSKITSLAVFQATSRPAAIRETDSPSKTTPFSAHRAAW